MLYNFIRHFHLSENNTVICNIFYFVSVLFNTLWNNLVMPIEYFCINMDYTKYCVGCCTIRGKLDFSQRKQILRLYLSHENWTCNRKVSTCMGYTQMQDLKVQRNSGLGSFWYSLLQNFMPLFLDYKPERRKHLSSLNTYCFANKCLIFIKCFNLFICYSQWRSLLKQQATMLYAR